MTDDQQPPAARTLGRAIWRDLRQCVGQLVAFEVFFKILGLAVFSPLSAWLLAAVVSSTGSLAIGNDEILAFLLSPTGIATLVLMGTVAAAIAMAEQAGLLVIAAGAQRGETPRWIAVLWYLVQQVPRLLHLALLQVAAFLACLVPFAAVAGFAYVGLLSEHNINYYLAERPPVFLAALALAAALLVGLLVVWGVLYVRWVFALPACVLSGQKPLAGLRGSFRQTRAAFWRLAWLLLLWLVATSGLGVAVAVALKLADQLILGLLGETLGVVVPTVAALMVVNILAAAALTLVGATSHGLLVARLYGAARGPQAEPAPGPVAPRPRAPAPAAWWTSKRVVFAAALVLLAGTTAISHRIVEGLDLEEQVAITAHRGSSRGAPENSLSAVRIAIEQGADYAEIDVQETADGVVVVLHDDDLMRVAGVARKIWEIDYEELSKLDAGSWFSPEFRGERIPRLEEVIELAEGRIKLNIELKYNGHDRNLAEKTVRIVKRHDFQSQCVLSSLTYEGLMDAKRFDGDLKVGYIVFRSLGDLAALKVDFFSLNADSVTEKLVDQVHAAGKQVHVWTVNDPKQMSSLVDLGVDNIITDDPPAMIAKLRERAELSNTERVLLRFRNWLAR